MLRAFADVQLLAYSQEASFAVPLAFLSEPTVASWLHDFVSAFRLVQAQHETTRDPPLASTGRREPSVFRALPIICFVEGLG